ncbi:hypothetical protein [Paenibacillus chitinolyticus]|uniref:hypothetical protein n=1 Tax=Paenibacillus chitinolyticus TaxID=79263 RepID=UPI001C46EC57|nr:hypothetical protein [Paenibacillus chitinolyticus]MBV6717212.1 hypothetical protein [Paenibacillus chitinolyticus]
MSISWGLVGILFLVSFLFFGAFVFVALRNEKGSNKKASQLYGQYFGKKINKHRANLFLQKSYVQFIRLPIISSYTMKIRKRLEALHSYDEYALRRETMKITFVTLGLISFLVLGLILISRDFIMTFWILLGAVVFNGMMIDTFVNRVEDRILKKSIIMFEDNRHHFQRLKNVEEALYEAVQTAPNEAAVHGKRIYEILSSEDQKNQLESYYEVAPNRYYKIFAGIAFLISEYGDRMVKTGSMYLHAISELVKEINNEILWRDRLTYLLKRLTTIAVAPVLFMNLLEDWARKYFPTMSDFYESKMGLLAEVVFLALVLICYLILKKMLENQQTRYMGSKKRLMWEKKLYEIKPIRWIIDRLKPGRHKRSHFKLTMLLKDANSPLTIEWLFIQRVTAAVACFIFLVTLAIYMHSMTTQDVLNNPLRGAGIYGRLSPDEVIKAQEKTDFDRLVIQDLKNAENVTPDLIIQRVSQITGNSGNDSGVIMSANRIYEKYTIIQNEYFKWWELVICLAFTLLAYNIPVWFLMLQKKLRHMEMQNEVDQFHTIISILSNFERVDVETILEWMERLAIIFKEPLKNCLNNYSGGQAVALDQLMIDAPFESFVRIVQKLQLATEKIPVLQAFDDLENSREYHAERKKEHINRTIDQKVTWGSITGFLPFGYLIFIYLVLPMLYLSMVQMTGSMKQITNL